MSCKIVKFQSDDTVTPFELKGEGMLYVTDDHVMIDTGDRSLEIPLDVIKSCSSYSRRLNLVWYEDGPVQISVHLARLPAAAAEMAIFESIYDGGVA